MRRRTNRKRTSSSTVPKGAGKAFRLLKLKRSKPKVYDPIIQEWIVFESLNSYINYKGDLEQKLLRLDYAAIQNDPRKRRYYRARFHHIIYTVKAS